MSETGFVPAWMWKPEEHRFVLVHEHRETFDRVAWVSEREVEEPPGSTWCDWRLRSWVVTGIVRIGFERRNSKGLPYVDAEDYRDTPELRALLGLGERETPVPYRK